MAIRDTTTTELTARGRASRERIVRSAARLMLARGVAATSLDDVLTDANASKSQLYHYFSGKQDLVVAVVDHARSLVLGSQQPLLEAIDSWAALERWADQVVDGNARYGTELGCPLGTLAAELAAADNAARALLDEAFCAWEHQVRDALTAMHDNGLLRAEADVEDLAIATIASLQGGLLLAKTARSSRPLRIALDAALNHVRSFAAAV